MLILGTMKLSISSHVSVRNLLINVHGVIYESAEHYMRDAPARCRGGMCPYFNLGKSMEYIDNIPIAKCTTCAQHKAATGEFPTGTPLPDV